MQSMDAAPNANSGLLASTWLNSLSETQSTLARKGLSGGNNTADTDVVVVPTVNTGGAPLPPQFLSNSNAALNDPTVFIQPCTPKWYKNAYFVQFCMIVVVFLLSLVLLISIRPSFLYVTPKNADPDCDKVFSASRAAWVAFGAALLALLAMVIIWVVSSSKARVTNTK
jgi:hypothetical protein